MEQLMATIGELFALSNLVFCVFIWIMVWIQRKVVELTWYKFKKTDIKKNKYWIYYINSETASVGASDYVVAEGDVILWNYEDSL